MRSPARLPAALLLLVSFGARDALAQTRLAVRVVHSNPGFDIRAVDAEGTAYALNLSRGSSEIWASTDHARSWTLRGRHPAGASFKQMAALRDGVLLADVQSSSGFALARSTDRGATWRNVLTLGQYRLLTPHSIEDTGTTVWLLEYQSYTSSSVPVRLWASADRGATWSVRFTFQGRRHGHGIRADATGALWAFFGDNDSQSAVLRSTDGGRTWATVLAGQEGRFVDGVLLDGTTLLGGQDVPQSPARPKIVRLSPTGALVVHAPLPGPSYSTHAVPGGGFLLGTTREIGGDVFAPGDISAHLFGSADGASWTELGSYPRIDDTDYGRADVYWVLRTGEIVLNLRHVQTLSGGRGYQLLRATVTDSANAVVWRDNFNDCFATTNPGAGWRISGRWYCKAGRARGESTVGGTALAETDLLGDTEVSALVQLNGSDLSGLVARADGGSWYAARLAKAGRVELVRVSGGTTTVLASAPATVLDANSYRFRLRVTGRAPAVLEFVADGTTLVRAVDSAAPLLAGRAGLLHGTGFRTQFDDFAVTGFAPGAPPPPVASADDNFDACLSETDLGPNWSVGGRWYCRVGRARGETTGGLALSRATLPANQSVQALVQLNGTATGSGVVARASGGFFYLARILSAGRLEIVRMENGRATVLGSAPRSFAVNTSYVVGLQVSGSATVQLVASVGGTPLLSATDASAARLLSGGAGLYSDAVPGSFFRTQFDNFVVREP